MSANEISIGSVFRKAKRLGIIFFCSLILILFSFFLFSADISQNLSENTDSIDKKWLLFLFSTVFLIIIWVTSAYKSRKFRKDLINDMSNITKISIHGFDENNLGKLSYNFKDFDNIAANILAEIKVANVSVKAAEAAEQRYQSLFQSNSIPLWEKDLSAFIGTISALLCATEKELIATMNLIDRKKWLSYLRLIKNNEVNLATLNLFGYTSAGELFADVDPVLSADNCFLLKVVIKALHEQRKIIRMERNLTALNGKQLDLLITMTFQISSEKPTLLISMVDISRQKLTTRRVEEEKEFVLSTLSKITDGVFAVDRDLAVTLINPAALNFFDMDYEKLKGMQVTDLFRLLNTITSYEFDKLIKEVITTGKTEELQEPVTIIGRNGVEYSIIPIIVAVFDGEGKNNGAVITFKDITNQKKLENERVTMKNMEAIGNLSGGFAHEFNNYLQAIIGNISLAGMYSATNQKVLQKVNIAKDLCLKAKTVTQRLLTFSLLGKPELVIADSSDFIKNSFSEVLSGTSIVWKVNEQKMLYQLKIDVLQIKQVIVDLAVFMMSNSGDKTEISIEIENYKHSANESMQLASGFYIRVTCLQKGKELPDEVINRIFDPYFTNKEIGVGLALASAYYTLINHHGFIEAFSKNGIGNFFRFYLPGVKHSISYVQQ